MNTQKICTLCGQLCSPRSLNCSCGATLPIARNPTEKKEIFDLPKESYEEYYHRVLRMGASPQKILSPALADAMVEEIREARKSGDTSPVWREEIRLKNFLKMFGTR